MQYHASHLMRAYARQPVSFVRGSGARLWDAQGFEYLDAIAGIAVTSLGHAHPEIAAAISEQAGLLLHTSNVFRIDWQERLGARLCALTGMQKAFFCNSGAEANEGALRSDTLRPTAPEISLAVAVAAYDKKAIPAALSAVRWMTTWSIRPSK